MSEKKLIRKDIPVEYDELFASSLDDTILYLQSIRAQYPTQNLELCEDCDDYSKNFSIHYSEMETDEEFEDRIKIEELKKKQEEKQKQVLIRNKKKETERQIKFLQAQLAKMYSHDR